MAESEALKRCLNPIVLNLKKMELELKCPTCLKLFELPVMLPCAHVICSDCVTILTKDESECPSCQEAFPHQDLRPAGNITSLINIYKEMNSAIAAKFSQQESKDRSLEAFSEDATLRMKGSRQSVGEEALVNKEEQCSPPSFGSNRDSDCDNSDNRNGHQSKRSPLTLKEEELGNKPGEQLDAGKSKRQKLNSTCDLGDKTGINARDFAKPNSDSEHDHKSISNAHPMDASRYSSTNRLVTCMFCHSFKSTEASGEMLHLLNGKEVDLEQTTQTNVYHVHRKCIEWAPQIYYSGDTVKNLEVELSRASKIKCGSCGLKGAALGCYSKSCQKSYHVPCAYEILECRWDCENFLMLCPLHSSLKLPCDKSKTKSKKKTKHSSDSFDSSSDLTLLTTPEFTVSSPSPIWNRGWVFCGSALSKEEKSILDKLACISKSVISNECKPDVTHIIASVNENGGCSRTLKVLMAILTGKWVLNIEWVKACIKAGRPVPEESYEVTHDVHGCFDGPNSGRKRAMEKAPKLLSGIRFYVADDFQRACFKKYVEDLILTGGGTLLQKNHLMDVQQANDGKTSTNVVIVYSGEPSAEPDSGETDKVLKQRYKEAEALAAYVGGQAISHATFLDRIAACHFELN